MPMAVGIAMAFALRRQPNVVVAFIGDGATSEGAVHESMNIAGVKRLPIVFVIENNGLGLSTRFADSTKAAQLALRGAGYGIEAHVVDGRDVTAVRDAAGAAVERARSDRLPTILEMTVTRPGLHVSMLDDVRTPAELAAARAADCVAFERARLDLLRTARGEDGGQLLEAELRAVVDRAVTEARALRDGRAAGPACVARYSDAEAWRLGHASAVPAWMEG